MSSILNALKKLDKSIDPPLVSTAGAIGPRHSMQQMFRPRRRLWPWGLALLILVLSAPTLLYFKGLWERSPITARPPSVQKPLTPAKQSPLAMAAPARQARKAVKPRHPAVAVRKAVRTAPPERKSPRKTSSAAGGKPTPVTTLTVHRAKAPAPSGARKFRSPIVPESPATPDSLKPLPAGAGLTLQALAWAPEPKHRFTVINNQIVRKGDSVDGMTVVRIDPAQVVLRKDGVLWQLRYHNRP